MGPITKASMTKLRAWRVAAGVAMAVFSAAAAMAQTAEKAVVENPYDLNSLWAKGDFVARGTLIILAVMSIGSWFIMLTKLWDQGRLRKQYTDVTKNGDGLLNINALNNVGIDINGGTLRLTAAGGTQYHVTLAASGTLGLEMPWKPSQPAMKSQASSCVTPPLT